LLTKAVEWKRISERLEDVDNGFNKFGREERGNMPNPDSVEAVVAYLPRSDMILRRSENWSCSCADIETKKCMTARFSEIVMKWS
jgi:hypothetical protein